MAMEILIVVLIALGAIVWWAVKRQKLPLNTSGQWMWQNQGIGGAKLRSPWAECLTVRSSLYVMCVGLARSGLSRMSDSEKPVVGLDFAGQIFTPAVNSVLWCEAKIRLGNGEAKEIRLRFWDNAFVGAAILGLDDDFLENLANQNELMISFPLAQGRYLGFRYSLRDFKEALAEAQEWCADKTGAQELLQELNDRQLKRLGNPSEDALDLAWGEMTIEEKIKRHDLLNSS